MRYVSLDAVPKPRAGPSPDGSSPRSSFIPGELFARPGSLPIRSRLWGAERVVRFYSSNGEHRRAVEQVKANRPRDGLGCRAIAFERTRSGCELSVLAYTLGNLWRRFGLPSRIKSWSLTTLQPAIFDEDWAVGSSSTPAITGCCWRRGI